MDYQKKCADACMACFVACEKCITMCLMEDHVKELVQCILLNRECAAICFATAKVLTVGADHYQILCRSCEELCLACDEECGKHADMPHCKECAEACRYCADLCRKIMNDNFKII